MIKKGKGNKKMKQVSMKIPEELHEIIMKLAKENERDFTKQVIYMIKQYLKITEKY